MEATQKISTDILTTPFSKDSARKLYLLHHQRGQTYQRSVPALPFN